MKSLIKLSILTILFLACSCVDRSYELVGADYNTVVVTAALNEMYWMEYNKEATKDELDTIASNPSLVSKLEGKLNLKLTSEQLTKITQQRQANYSSYNW